MKKSKKFLLICFAAIVVIAMSALVFVLPFITTDKDRFAEMELVQKEYVRLHHHEDTWIIDAVPKGHFAEKAA